MEAINKRKMDELKCQADLHGVKMNTNTQGRSMSVDDDWDRLKNLGIVKDK